MFSKSQIKFINSLAQKKYRHKHRLFLVEGKKGISELLASPLKLHSLYTAEDIFEAEEEKTFFVSEQDIKKLSRLSTPQTAVAVFEMPVKSQIEFSELVLVLDGIQDPGNLGTIIRMCDWFGISHLVCSNDTVDCYNPKVIQATMGSISRVSIHYESLPLMLNRIPKETNIYGAFLEGKNIYKEDLPFEGIVIMGNEANGISPEVEEFVSRKLVIPRFGENKKAESLNVATATAIVLSEFRRRS